MKIITSSEGGSFLYYRALWVDRVNFIVTKAKSSKPNPPPQAINKDRPLFSMKKQIQLQCKPNNQPTLSTAVKTKGMREGIHFGRQFPTQNF